MARIDHYLVDAVAVVQRRISPPEPPTPIWRRCLRVPGTSLTACAGSKVKSVAFSA